MCLSPGVDVAAAVAISVVAVDALRHNHHARTLPLALLPGLFAVHTLSSAFVWWGADGTVSPAVGDAASSFFMLIAFVVLPVYMPWAVVSIEPPGWRRDALLLLGGAGALAGLDFLLGLLGGQGEAIACDYYIDYTITGTASVSGVLYAAATCGALLLSGQRSLFLWGVTNAVVVVVLAQMAQRALPSLWCFWAACSSVFVAWFLRRLERRRARGEPWPWMAYLGRTGAAEPVPPAGHGTMGP